MNKFLAILLILSSGHTFSKPYCRCRPSEACWPSKQEWFKLKQALNGRLVRPKAPFEVCKKSQSQKCREFLKKSKSPFFLSDTIGATQSAGWKDAWKAAVSPYAVVAESAKDISVAVNFVRKHQLRLVVKGTGHDYLGRSNAPDSLLIWTHKMRKVFLHNAFVGQGCKKTKGIPAVSAMAGAMWIDAYREVTKNNGRYVQGGGCTSVGVAGGFLQGGGFGSWSKKFGTAASNLLEAEVVTADGNILIANACQHQDLFWALRGGGGGTFGVVARVTLRTHELPKFFGIVGGKITAKDDRSFKRLIERFLKFYKRRLHNEHWGEQATFAPNNALELLVTSQGLDKRAVEKTWAPFVAWIKARPKSYKLSLQKVEIPGRKIWDADYWKKTNPSLIELDNRPNQPPGQFHWKGDGGQVSMYWYAYQSRWIPEGFFALKNVKASSKTVFEASRHQRVAFHFNKALAGGDRIAIQRTKQTSTNPKALYAAALVIIADGRGKTYLDIKGHRPNRKYAQAAAKKVSAAMNIIKKATPGSGAYVNEADYFEPHWQDSFWGKNYPRLLRIKKKYDPEGLFYCHHCVGSESWQKGGMCRIPASF